MHSADDQCLLFISSDQSHAETFYDVLGTGGSSTNEHKDFSHLNQNLNHLNQKFSESQE